MNEELRGEPIDLFEAALQCSSEIGGRDQHDFRNTVCWRRGAAARKQTNLEMAGDRELHVPRLRQGSAPLRITVNGAALGRGAKLVGGLFKHLVPSRAVCQRFRVARLELIVGPRKAGDTRRCARIGGRWNGPAKPDLVVHCPLPTRSTCFDEPSTMDRSWLPTPL
jgi:hypothetical protein